MAPSFAGPGSLWHKSVASAVLPVDSHPELIDWISASFRKYGYERRPTSDAMNRAPTDGLEHLESKRRGPIHCARADGPPYLDKLIPQLYSRNTLLLSLANYGGMARVQTVGAQHAVPVIQSCCILRDPISYKSNARAVRNPQGLLPQRLRQQNATPAGNHGLACHKAGLLAE